MSLTVAVLKEHAAGERRVALDPATANKLTGEQYADCVLLDDAESILTMTDIWLWVQAPPAEQLAKLPEGKLCMGLVFAHRNPAVAEALKQHRLSCMAMELVPRISRAQSMDVLSSQATVAGYKAVIRGATLAPRLDAMSALIRPAVPAPTTTML